MHLWQRIAWTWFCLWNRRDGEDALDAAGSALLVGVAIACTLGAAALVIGGVR